jgi:prepilin peptidase CpaA
MVCTAVLLGFLTIATVTDIRQRKVFNWTTYPGIVVAILGSAIATSLGADTVQGSQSDVELLGIVSISDALVGFLACGLAMLVCYVFFPGGVGGGDVKLIAMIGAFLGLYEGLEVMLWTFVLGGCQALITLIWRVGAIELIRRSLKYCWFIVRSGGHASPSTAETKSPAVMMFLSPSTLLSVLIVRLHLLEWLHFV